MTTSSKRTSNSGAGISRRAFVTGAAAAGTIAAAAGLAGCSQPASDGGAQASPSDETASGAYSWETPPAPIDDADIADTYDCEVCVVGAGLSGVTTALRAAEEGLNVLVLQNLNEANTQGTGASAVNSKRQIDQGLEISDADRAELMRIKCSLEGGLVNYDLFNLWMDNSGAAIDYVCDHSMKNGVDAMFDVIENWREADDWVKTFQISSMFAGETESGALALVHALVPQVEEAGGTFVYGVTAQQLGTDESGRVNAVFGQKSDGSYVKVNASKAVVICTGGYEGNTEMRQKYLPHAMAFDTITSNQGEGILMGMWVGAKVDDPPHASNIHYNIAATDAWGSAVPWLRVNKAGKRVGNEDITYGYLPFLDRESEGTLAYQIFDSDFDKYYYDIIENGCAIFRSFPPASATASTIELATDEDTSDWSDLKKIYESCVEAGSAVKADTLEELADLCGIDKEAFVATVERYNELYDGGADLDYGKSPKRMHAVKTPPFYAIERKAYILGTLNGLDINTNMQVLNTEGEVIPGLYAAGNASGGNFFGGLAQGMAVPASTISRAITWGYLAAGTIAENE